MLSFKSFFALMASQPNQSMRVSLCCQVSPEYLVFKSSVAELVKNW